MTPKQSACLQAIRDLTNDTVPPTYEELAAHLCITKLRVHYILKLLERDGYISLGRYRKRSISILERRSVSLHDDLMSLVNVHGFQSVFAELYRVNARLGGRA